MAPFILLPSSLPRREFDKSVRLQPILNELTHKVAHDEAFLRDTLAETIKVDEFTRKLFEIYDKVWKDDKTQVHAHESTYSFLSDDSIVVKCGGESGA